MGAAAAVGPPAFWRTARARHVPVRLQCRVPRLLPLLGAAVVPGEAFLLLQDSEQGVQVEYPRVNRNRTGACARPIFQCLTHWWRAAPSGHFFVHRMGGVIEAKLFYCVPPAF